MLNVFDTLLMVTVRSAIPSSDAIDTYSASSYRMCS